MSSWRSETSLSTAAVHAGAGMTPASQAALLRRDVKPLLPRPAVDHLAHADPDLLAAAIALRRLLPRQDSRHVLTHRVTAAVIAIITAASTCRQPGFPPLCRQRGFECSPTLYLPMLQECPPPRRRRIRPGICPCLSGGASRLAAARPPRASPAPAARCNAGTVPLSQSRTRSTSGQ
jgi:hypothetical protein